MRTTSIFLTLVGIHVIPFVVPLIAKGYSCLDYSCQEYLTATFPKDAITILDGWTIVDSSAHITLLALPLTL